MKSSASNKLVLSVILPLNNAQEDILPLFKSISSQTNIPKESIEIVAINDGSVDSTADEIEKHKHLLKDYRKFRLMTHKLREGLSQTRFDAVNGANGEYVLFVDKRIRPDTDYIENFLNKRAAFDTVIGNIYMDKMVSVWDRLLVLVRQKIYHPYFNHDFDDISLDFENYRRFKNKGGGGAMMVLRSSFLEVARDLPKGKDVNDDSLLIEDLAKLKPLLKTSTARAKYLNRTRFADNIVHFFNRGPKFVDYYIKPGTRFFPAILGLIIIMLSQLYLVAFYRQVLLYEIMALVVVDIVLGIYLAEEPLDFLIIILLSPLAALCFTAGILKGLAKKILGLY